MKILLSNDDGYKAPGLAALADALAPLASHLEVVAPLEDRSGSSSALTLKRPLTLRTAENGFHYIDGTPTDCVHIATTALLDPRPDIVVSGINSGANLGDDSVYSGTLAAAIEGRHLRYPPISMSLVGNEHFDTAARVARALVSNLEPERLPRGIVFNVNVPDLPYDELKGFRLSRLGRRHEPKPAIRGEYVSSDDDSSSWWIGGIGDVHDGGADTDFGAVSSGFVSVTPLQIDMTWHDAFLPAGNWLEGLTL